MNHPRLLLCGWALSALPVAVHAQCNDGKLVPADGDFGAQMGTAMALSGDYAVLGAPYDNAAGTLTGAIHFFERQAGTWSAAQKLTASDIADRDRIGFSVAIEGDMALAGSRYDEEAGYGTGAAYLFERQGGAWVETEKLVASDMQGGAFFGQSVAILNSDLVVVAAHADDEIAVDAGSVYVFERQAGVWNETAKLNASDGLTEDQFGWSVSASGDWIFVGARGADDFGPASGAVYAFERVGGTWVERQKLLASDGASPARFGISLDVDGTRAAIGASFDPGAGDTAGAVYLFELQGGVWVEVLKLTAGDAAPGDRFGSSLSLDGNLLAVGALGDDDAGNLSGSVYLYESGVFGWAQRAKVIPSGVGDEDGLGASVGVSQDTLLVPARGDDDLLLNAGALHVYSARDRYRLESNETAISIASGGHQDFQLSTCPARPGALFFLLGTTSGTDVGVSFGDFHLPLNLDFYLINCLLAPNLYPLPVSQAALDVDGLGAARFELNPGENASLVGLTLHHAYGLIDPQLGLLREASETLALQLLP